jgi:hypothetical protein
MVDQQREAWAQRLYTSLPEFYRSQDLAQARQRAPNASDDELLNSAPLLGLLRAIAGQVSAVRQDLDDLWDDFFIETCDDWVVPYLGSLLGTNLLPNPVGQSNRLDVRYTLLFRASKGTPRMLQQLAAATTGWHTGFHEFFKTLAWNQNLDHVRPQPPLTADLRDPFQVSRLGRDDDPFAHLVDIRPSRSLDAPRTVLKPGSGEAAAGWAWGTPGRHGIKNLGFFERRLLTFPTRGVTPAPTGTVDPATARGYTFDPLGRNVPLFSQADGLPISRAAFEHDPGVFFAPGGPADVVVRRHGVALATPGPGEVSYKVADQPFAFGNPAPGVKLDAAKGMRMLEPELFRAPAEHFVVTAYWSTTTSPVRLGALATLRMTDQTPEQPGAFRLGDSIGPDGVLMIRIETGRPDAAFWPDLPVSDAGRFPASVLAVRDDQPPRAAREGGGARVASSAYQDAILVYLPEAFVRTDSPVDLLVGADGSTYYAVPGTGQPQRGALARVAEGQLWPPADLTQPSVLPADLSVGLHRRVGLRLADPTRLAGVPGVMIEARRVQHLELLGGLSTVQRSLPSDDPLRRSYLIPDGQDWPAFGFIRSQASDLDAVTVGQPGLLGLHVSPVDPAALAAGDLVVPQFELVVTDRGARSLLVYIGELELSQAQPEVWLVVAQDGSTYQLLHPPAGDEDATQLPLGSILGRVGGGQVMPIEGEYPLQRRLVIGRGSRWGRLTVDPERGIFCLAPNDPLLALALADRDLSVDYVEAFSDRVGAHAFDREAGVNSAATRIVAASGDAATTLPFWRIHSTLTEAVTACTDGDVIEIADSSTYTESVRIDLSQPATLRSLTVRAADHPDFQRPCVIEAGGRPAIKVIGMLGFDPRTAPDPANSLQLEGLLLAGGVMQLFYVSALAVAGCTLLAADSGGRALMVADPDGTHRSQVLVCRCLCGPLAAEVGVHRLLVADSIVDGRDALDGQAICASPAYFGDSLAPGSEPATPAGNVQLERVTVFGGITCQTLVGSESLLADRVVVTDAQSGCLRYSRYQPGSQLPSRFQCVPSDRDLANGDDARPSFTSRQPASPAYGQLSAACSQLVLTASEARDEVGAFAGTFPSTRVANLGQKLQEFLPVGLNPLVLAET